MKRGVISMRIVDLSLPITANTKVYPGDTSPEIVSTRADHDDYMISSIRLGSHTGTHIDAPRHALVDGSGLGTQPLDSYIGEALVIDLHETESSSIISHDMVEEKWRRHNNIDMLIIRTDWYKRCEDDSALNYFSDYPALDLKFADWLIDNEIRFIGLESPSISATDHMRIHRRLLAENIVILESLINVSSISVPVVELHAVPLNIPGIDGSPVRAYAIER